MDAAADKRAGGTAATRPGRAALGKYAKSATPPPRDVVQATRAERYELLAAARGLFLHQGKHEGLEHPANWHRTAKCKWVTHGGAVGVHASCQHDGAFYSGLVNCGSVWACPVCAAKVQERRRVEIAAAIDWAYARGLQPVMVTLTFPHYAWDNLTDLIAHQADALHRLRAGAPWTRFKQAHGYEGLIRSLELTFGANGWHPHTHELWFVDADVDAEAMGARVLERWRSSCARAGLLDLSDDAQVSAFDRHAVDVKGWCSTSDYLAKQDDSRHWGADREIAKASTKRGKAKGLHPFGLLADAAEGDKVAGGRFVEYAQVMKGRRQLFWSRDLKARVGLAELTDEELAEADQDTADLLGLLTLAQWRAVRSAGKRAQLLDAAEVGGWSAVLELLATLEPADDALDDQSEAEPEPVVVPVEQPAPVPQRPPAATPLHEWLAAQRAANPGHWAAISDGETIRPRRLRLPPWMTATMPTDTHCHSGALPRFCPPGEGPTG